MTVPYTFAGQAGAIPLSELDANFASVPNFANVANTVTANAQPNITSVGTLTSLTVTGNIITNILFQNAPFISLGANAGFSSQTDIIAIGNAAAGNNNQQAYGIAIGSQAGYNLQGANAVSIGGFAGANNQGSEAVAIGFRAGNYYQSGNAVAIGRNAGNSAQGGNAVAIGRNSGNINQGANAVSVGRNAGNISQGVEAVAIGHSAGNTEQGAYSVAIGTYAGNNFQGPYSVAIGSYAGYPTVANNAIVINGDNTSLDAPDSGLYISPIRNNNSSNTVFYNTTTKEITYSTAYGNANVAAYLPTNSSNVSGNYFIGNGSLLTGINASNIVGNYGNANVAAYLPTNTSNVRANYFIGNGSLLTGIATGPASQIINGNSNINIGSAGSNIVVTVGNTQSATFFTSGMSLPGNVTSGNVNANRIYANAGISSTGNITTAGYFIGTFQGNVSGNIVVPGSNTQVLYNNNGNAGASTAFTFNAGSNLLTVLGNITATGLVQTTGQFLGNAVTANYAYLGNASVSGTISGNGAGLTNVVGLVSRSTTTVTSGNLAPNASANIIATGFKGYALYSISCNNAAWITLYTSNAAAASDYTRSISTDPTPGSGVIAEAISNANAVINFTPATIGFNNELSPTNSIPMKIVNNGNSNANISVTLTLLRLEG